MLPKTELYQLGKLSKEMSLVIGGRVHPVLNSRKTGSLFFSPCSGMNFPLGAGETILEIEEGYYKRNRKLIEKEKAQKIGELNDKYIKNLENNFQQKRDVLFFLTEVCPAYDWIFGNMPKVDISDFLRKDLISEVKISGFDSKAGILTSLIDNCAVVLGRIYAIRQIEPSVYELAQPIRTIDSVEEEFQRRLMERITREASSEFEKADGKTAKISELEEAVDALRELMSVKKYPHCYEYGDLGYDFSAKLLYWLVLPHQNHTAEREYGEGQSSITLPLEKRKVGSNFRFAERDSRENSFSINSQPNCYGGATSMPPLDSKNPNSLYDRMFALRTCAVMVWKDGRFHQAPAESSGGDD